MNKVIRYIFLLLAWSPAQAVWAQCAQTNTLDFTNAATPTDDWKNHAAVTIAGTTTTIATSGYTSTAGITNSFSVTATGNLPNKALAWQQDNASATGNQATVTFTFNAPVTNLVLRISDIDRNVSTTGNFIDKVTFNGYNTTSATPTTAITLAAGNFTLGRNDANTGNSNQFVSPNALQGIDTSNGNNLGTSTVTFPSPVDKVTLTYENLAASNNGADRLQVLGIESISFCALTNVATTLATAQTSVSAGTNITYTATVQNNGPATATGVAPQVQLPAGLAASTFTLPTGASYNNNTGVVTLPTTASLAPGAANALTYAISFTAPNYATTVTGVASSTSTSTDPVATNNNGSQANAQVSTVVTLPVNGCAGTPYGATATSGLYAQYYAGYFNDDLTYFASRTAGVTRTDGNLNFAADNGWGNIVPPATGTLDNPDTYSARYRGSISIATAGTYTFYLNSDDASYLWLDGAALATSPTLASATINNSGQHVATTVQASVTLSAGSHNLLVFFGENGGDNVLTLQYSGPGITGTVVVPNSVLCATLANVPPVATAVTNAPILPNTASFTTIAPLAGTDQDGTVPNYVIVTLPAAAEGVLRLNSLNVTAGQVITAAQAAQLQFDPAATFVGNSTFTFQARDNSGQLSNLPATYTIPVGAVLAGTVFEDVNYGGGSGRSLANALTANTAFGTTIQRPGATVELYDASGNYISSTTTNASGAYSFNVTSVATYTVRVVNSTVTSARSLVTGASAAGLVPVQTYVRNDVNRVGGEAPEKQDAAANTGAQTLTDLNTGTGATALTAQSVSAVAVPVAGVSDANFGFNFDAITSTRDAGQGSLRQFILNSNALDNVNLAQTGLPAGQETSVFMISNGAGTTGLRAGLANQFSGGAATITLATTPPAITDGNTAINGSRQTAQTGDTNPVVTTAGAESTGPEVVIDFGTQTGFSTSVANTSFIGLGLTNATPNMGSGNAALSILAGATGAVVQNNTLYDSGANMRINGVGGATVTGNISRHSLNNNSDGIEMTGSSSNTITNNQFLNNAGYGIDFITGASNSNTITGNVFSGNGFNSSNGQTAGIGLRDASSNNVITNNTFTANVGNGITALQGINNVFSRNSFYDNGALGIDLSVASTTAFQGDGVTLNDSGDGDGTGTTASGNGLINFPVIQTVTVRNGNLLVTGFATAGSVVELYVSDNFTTSPSFGEGKTFLASRTEGLTGDDFDATTGSYGPAAINGLAQGTETGQRRFSFSIPLSSLTAAQLAQLNLPNAQLTTTATLATLTNGNQGTSEFSGTAPVLQAPTANNDFATTTANPAAPVTLNAIGNDTPAATLVGTTLNLNPNNLAGQSATTYTVAGQGTFTTVGAPAGQVIFTPANLTFTGNVTIPYTISNNQGVVSNQANLTVTVNPVLDLVTTVTSPANNASVTAGASLTYTVTAQNASAVVANNVTETLQLVPGLLNNGGLVTYTVNGSASTTPTYDNTTGLVTFTPTPITLNANTTNNYVVTFTKAPVSGSVVATANISSTAGSNGPELNRTNNFDTKTLNIVPSYDVSTSITGSVDGAGTAASVVPGGMVTYLVRTTNSATSISPAPAVVQSVTFDGNVTASIFISNGGTAVYNGTKTVVTFPALATLPVGQTVTNSISFPAPNLAAGATYAATANVQANGSTAIGANNPGDTNTGTGSNDAASVTTTMKAATGTSTNVYTTISSNTTVTTAGTTVTLTAVAGNNGPAAAANVVEQVVLPAGLTGPGAGGTVVVTNGSYNSTTGVVTFNTITNLGVQLTNNTTTTPTPFTIQFNAPAAGPVLATATVRQDNADAIPADNVAEVKVDVNGPTDVTTAISGPATATVGQAVTYAVTTANAGTGTAYGVVQTVQLPAGLGTSGVTFGGAATGSYNNATGVATFTLTAPLQAGSRQVNTLTFALPANVITDPSGTTAGSNQLTLAAGVRTVTTETSSTNNLASVITAVTPAADATVAVSGPASALPGNPVTFAVTTTNNGPVPVASTVTTLQLPAGLTSNGGTVLVNGTAAGASYDNTTGLVTFATAANLPLNGSVANTVTVVMPDVTQLTPVARAQVGSATIDTNLDNNRASVTTTGATATTGTADLATVLSILNSPTSVSPGATVTLNATFSNPAGGSTAANVVPRVQLQAGLANNGTVTVAGGTGGSYDNTTGLVTWNTVPTLTAGTTLSGYSITFNAPSSGTVAGTSYVASATADAVAANNASSVSVPVTSQSDLTTSVSGPAAALAGSRVTYNVVTSNSGPSPSGAVTQTVTIPATATNVTYPAGSTAAAPSGGTIVITFPAIATMAATAAGAVVNYVAFDAPTANYTVSANVSTTGSDTNTGNNAASTPTAVDRTPLAYDVVSTLQTPIGSTAGPVKVSPLLGTDPDAGQTATLTHTLTSLPSATNGVLYLDAAGTTLAATGTPYTAAQIASLYFDPIGTIGASTYVGNAFFTYTTTDVVGVTSAPALYTIAVGKDENSSYVALGTKGGTTPYQNNDPITNLIDANTVKYNTDGTAPYGKYLADRSVNPVPANSGFLSVTQTGGTLAPGVGLDPATGQLYVLNRLALVAGSYSITVTTVDANGGTNTLVVPYTIGARPLPVELAEFTVQAVKNLDALLNWRTATEKSNDHFDVERSLNGTDFVKIGQVKGQGNSASAASYALTDAGIGAKVKDLVYYRLKQVDADGTSSFSPVRTVRFTGAAPEIGLSVYPNPASAATGATLDLSTLPAGTYQVQLLDLAGRAVGTYRLDGARTHALDVRTLASGTYVVRVVGQALTLTTRLVKE